jgi:DNA segregation ATPase FtsK/SpoIIIE, S-DNA-T family
VLWIVATLAAAAFASCLPASKAWPLPTGLGGVIGDALLRLPAWVFGAPLSGATRFVVAVVIGMMALSAIALAAGFGWHDEIEEEEVQKKPKRARKPKAKDAEAEAAEPEEQEEPEPRALVSLGWFYHGVYSLKAQLILLVSALFTMIAQWLPWRRRPRVVALRHDPSMVRLAEPGAEPYGNPADDQAEEEEDEEEGEEEEEGEDDEAAIEVAPRKHVKPAAKPAQKRKGGYEFPSLALLAAPKPGDRAVLSTEAIQENATALESVLGDFGVRGEIINAHPGPVVTLYELEPAPGIKSSRVIGLADDIARSMSAVSARVAVVSGRNAIGIELPNPTREKVYLRELLSTEDFNNSNAKLPLCLGKTIGGEPVIVDLARMPHLLIAGTTGSGKSVAINTMILSLIYRLPPDRCKFIMVDPKMLELSGYDGIPHLLAPVVTDPRKAIVALKWTVREMEGRYRKMSQLGVRNIEGYNQRVEQAAAKGETLTRKVQTGFNPETGAPIYEEQAFDLSPLPFIVVVVDEMADLMLVAGKDIEAAVQRLAQMARAAGIHIIMATQRPSVDVITGTIKANFPTRVSFHVTSRIDSRTILSEPGAEQLLGQGDMLYMGQGGRIVRVHGPFVSDGEVESVVRHLKEQGTPAYIEDVTREEEEPEGSEGSGGEEGSGDDLYDKGVQLVSRERKASTSFVQRHLQIGYNRAARLIERMEKEGVVSPANHVGKREVLARNSDAME